MSKNNMKTFLTSSHNNKRNIKTLLRKSNHSNLKSKILETKLKIRKNLHINSKCNMKRLSMRSTKSFLFCRTKREKSMIL